MQQFLLTHPNFTVPTLMAILGGIALACDVYVIRPRRREAEAKAVAEARVDDFSVTAGTERRLRALEDAIGPGRR